MKRFLSVIIVMASLAVLAGCTKSRSYTTRCADLEVRGFVKDADGRGLGSLTVTIAHTTKDVTEYTYTSEDVLTTAPDGSFSKVYMEFYPPYTNLKLTVSDPSGIYQDKTVLLLNVIYQNAEGLYEGYGLADFKDIKLYLKNN